MGWLDQMGGIALLISPFAYFSIAVFYYTGETELRIYAAALYFFFAIVSARLTVIAVFNGLLSEKIKQESITEYDWEKKQNGQ